MFEAPNRYRFLYLIRHGQYRSTEEYPDGELTELGRRQARLVAKHLSGVPVDKIWCSTMSRAEETAGIIAEHAFDGHEVQRARLLRERIFPGHDWYEKEGLKKYRDDGGMIDRIFKRWMRPSRSERHEILVCHGNLIRAITTRLMGLDLESWWTLPHFNCGVTKVGVFDHDHMGLLSYNEHTFLPDEVRSAS